MTDRLPSNLPRRTWPYGTRKRVRVDSVTRRGQFVGLVCIETEGAAPESFVIIDGGNAYAAVGKGDTGMITFTQGGPTGGHWVFAGDRV